VDALYKLVEAGVRAPKPFGYFNDTLVMELMTDGAGDPAPRLGEVDLTPEVAREYHAFVIRQAVRMLCIGLIHGDSSEFNVLVAADGPVIIDLPQAVNAVGNNQAFAMLERDVNNLRGTLGRFAPELLETECAREIWALFTAGSCSRRASSRGCFCAGGGRDGHEQCHRRYRGRARGEYSEGAWTGELEQIGVSVSVGSDHRVD
jgi:RIO kinase 1